MPILAKVAKEVKAVAAVKKKTFPDLWLKRIIIDAATTDSGFINILTSYFNAETGELDGDPRGPEDEDIVTNELFAAIQEVPEVAQAYGAILTAVPALRIWIADKEEARLEAIEAARVAELEAIEEANALVQAARDEAEAAVEAARVAALEEEVADPDPDPEA